MTKLITLLTFAFFLTIKTNGQNIDSLQLTDKEIPENYSLIKDNNCISIQACTFYNDPEMYGMLVGKLKTKGIQNFDNKKDKGSIMYFEFEDGFKGEGFLGGLLWGGDKPTKEHPEEYYAKGNFLIIWSFKKGSLITNTSKNKIKVTLKGRDILQATVDFVQVWLDVATINSSAYPSFGLGLTKIAKHWF